MLEDIAIVTGGQVISEEKGQTFEKIDVSLLGRAKKVIAKKDSTTIVDGQGDKSKIEARISQIRNEIKTNSSDFDKEKLQERLGKLVGGVAVIKVGAPTEVEQKAKQHKAEDALSATKAAIEEGVVPGGGVALLRASSALENFKAEGDEKTGVEILKRALEEPLRMIAKNAGIEGSVAVENIRKQKGSYGLNAQTLEYEDLMKSGIVDPTKVVRSALENAVSGATMLLTTEATVTDLPKKEGSENHNHTEEY